MRLSTPQNDLFTGVKKGQKTCFFRVFYPLFLTPQKPHFLPFFWAFLGFSDPPKDPPQETSQNPRKPRKPPLTHKNFHSRKYFSSEEEQLFFFQIKKIIAREIEIETPISGVACVSMPLRGGHASSRRDTSKTLFIMCI